MKLYSMSDCLIFPREMGRSYINAQKTTRSNLQEKKEMNYLKYSILNESNDCLYPYPYQEMLQ